MLSAQDGVAVEDRISVQDGVSVQEWCLSEGWRLSAGYVSVQDGVAMQCRFWNFYVVATVSYYLEVSLLSIAEYHLLHSPFENRAASFNRWHEAQTRQPTM